MTFTLTTESGTKAGPEMVRFFFTHDHDEPILFIVTGQTFTIFRAGFGDEALALQAMVEVHGHTDVEFHVLSESLRDLSIYIFLAVENNRVLASLNGYALQRPHRYAHQFLLYEIDVRPECRRQGIGKALLQSFIQLARTSGASEIWLLSNESNAAAMQLYRSCGFERPNSDDVMLQLSLDK
jgi:ribosomal protein S18 acetylase RimI-like enzyme